jgi:hypothetical protein
MLTAAFICNLSALRLSHGETAHLFKSEDLEKKMKLCFVLVIVSFFLSFLLFFVSFSLDFIFFHSKRFGRITVIKVLNTTSIITAVIHREFS